MPITFSVYSWVWWAVVPHHEAHDEVERDSTDQTVNNDFHASRPKPDSLPGELSQSQRESIRYRTLLMLDSVLSATTRESSTKPADGFGGD
jgi:hypothetical protein